MYHPKTSIDSDQMNLHAYTVAKISQIANSYLRHISKLRNLQIYGSFGHSCLEDKVKKCQNESRPLLQNGFDTFETKTYQEKKEADNISNL